MSAQTDCEMLSIEVMEAYAGKYNLSGNKVVCETGTEPWIISKKSSF